MTIFTYKERIFCKPAKRGTKAWKACTNSPCICDNLYQRQKIERLKYIYNVLFIDKTTNQLVDFCHFSSKEKAKKHIEWYQTTKMSEQNFTEIQEREVH